MGLAGARLFIVFLDWNGLEVFGLEDLVADEALHVIDAISPSDDFGLGMFASGLHNNALMRIILTGLLAMSRPTWAEKYRRQG